MSLASSNKRDNENDKLSSVKKNSGFKKPIILEREATFKYIVQTNKNS